MRVVIILYQVILLHHNYLGKMNIFDAKKIAQG